MFLESLSPSTLRLRSGQALRPCSGQASVVNALLSQAEVLRLRFLAALLIGRCSLTIPFGELTVSESFDRCILS